MKVVFDREDHVYGSRRLKTTAGSERFLTANIEEHYRYGGGSIIV
jgi:hypothetical protein